jgi:hypothetical protein
MTSPDTPRTTRGGPYVVLPGHGRSACRNLRLAFVSPVIGFRVVCLPREVAPPRMPLMLLRGGSWFFRPRYCGSTLRAPSRSSLARHDFGFRVVCLPREVTP